MDLTKSIQPSSDQIDAVEFLAGPRTVTITGIRAGSAEQPVQLDLAEFDRPFRPSKTVRRILVAAWGADGNKYIGRRMTLFRDPKVVYGGIAVGGIRVSHLSNIDSQMSIVLAISRGKTGTFKIDPLPPAEQPVVWAGLTDAMKATGADQQTVLDLASQVTGEPTTSLHGLTQDQVDRLTALVAQTAVTVDATGTSKASTKENEND